MPSLADLEKRLRDTVNAKVFRAEGVLEEAVQVGAEIMRETLLDEPAWTNTGLEREAIYGGEPGRYDTGAMYDAITTNVDSPIIDNDAHTTILKAGWFSDTYKAYFYEQDMGVGKIPAAHAMALGEQAALKHAREGLQNWAQARTAT